MSNPRSHSHDIHTVGGRWQHTGNRKHPFGILCCREVDRIPWQRVPPVKSYSHRKRHTCAANNKSANRFGLSAQPRNRDDGSSNENDASVVMCFVLSNTNSLGKSNGLGSVIYFPRPFLYVSLCLLFRFIFAIRNVVMCRTVCLLFITGPSSIFYMHSFDSTHFVCSQRLYTIVRCHVPTPWHGICFFFRLLLLLLLSKRLGVALASDMGHHKYEWLFLFVDGSNQITGRRDQFCHFYLIRENEDGVQQHQQQRQLRSIWPDATQARNKIVHRYNRNGVRCQWTFTLIHVMCTYAPIWPFGRCSISNVSLFAGLAGRPLVAITYGRIKYK